MNEQLPTRQRLLLFVGSIGPLGHLPASGTITVAIVGIPLFYFMHDLPWLAYALITAVFVAASIAIHEAGDRILGEKDSRKLVWDELAGFMVAVAFIKFSWPIAIAAFLAERAIDIVKVPPANWIEKRVPGGWGVVGDDLVAGLYTNGLVRVLLWLLPAWGAAGMG
ncbi:MAG: phosphatidylglycerophosphatase A [Planctomycetes bacterium]|nr:phosphatidylglycerophosphatase A [Planctomycetota bacterium]